jgi:hypothetical protein
MSGLVELVGTVTTSVMMTPFVLRTSLTVLRHFSSASKLRLR